jgi:stringent starvation protein B
MTSSRPYLIRAIYQWIVDNGLTPYILVDASDEAMVIPRQYVEDGKIVLNIAPMAVRSLTLGNDEISFNARFGGQPMQVAIPVSRVLATYARENGQGMMFQEEDGKKPPPTSGGDDSGKDSTRPSLRVVK